MSAVLSTDARTERWPAALVFAAHTALALWWLWPLPRFMATNSANVLYSPSMFGANDFNLMVWALSWDCHALVTAPWRLFHGNTFFPAKLSLAFSEHLLGLLPVFGPVYALWHNPVLAANVVIIASYPICGLAMYFLARRFLSRPAALVASLFYAFCEWRWEMLPSFHTLAVWGLPLAVLFTERWLERGRPADAIWLCVSLVLQVLAAFYLAYALLVLYVPYLVAALIRWRAEVDRRRLVGLALAGGVTGVILGAVSLPYLELRRLGLIPNYAEYPPPLGVAFAPAMTLAYLKKGVGVVGYALALVALLPPWRWRAWACTIGLLAVFFGTMAAFGTQIPIPRHPIPGPYQLMTTLIPGFSAVRVLVRFAVVSHLGFSLLAGLGLERLLRIVPRRLRWAGAFATAAAAIYTAVPGKPLPLDPAATGDKVPPAIRWLGSHNDGRALLEVPSLGAYSMFLSIYHWLPVIGGYSAYPPRSAEYVNSLTDDLPNEDTLQTIVDTVDVGWILVRTAYLPADRKRAWNGPLPEGVERIQTFAGGDMVIRVTRQPRDDRRARLLSETETLAGVPLAELGAACPGAITLAEPPATPWQPNRRRKMTVEVHNDGTSAWPGRGFVPRHLVEVRACFGVADSTDCPPVHFALPADVPPGGSVRVPVSLVSPFFPGNFRIHVSLSQVGDGPLARCGVKPFSTPVRVGR